MRIINFEQYDPKETVIGASARAWIICWMAVNNYPAGNKEQTLVGNKVYNALREVSEAVGEGRRLLPFGAEVYLDDAEFRLLGNAVEKFRENINIGNSDALLYVDRLLEKAPEISKVDYVAKIKGLKVED